MGLSQTPQALVPAAFSAGGMTLISEQVASGLSSLSFTSLGSYKQLLLVWSGINHSDSATRFNLRFNNDASNIYAQRNLGFRNNAIEAGGQLRTSVGGDALVLFGYGANYGTMQDSSTGYMIIDNYTSTTKLKFCNIVGGFYDNGNGTGQNQEQLLVMYNTTTAITSLDIFRQTGTGTFSNLTNSSIRLYGIS